MKPFLFLISLSAPFLNNNLRTRKLPEIAARWEGVSPSLFCLLTSAGGSCSSKYFIISKLPLAALRCNKVFPLSSTSLFISKAVLGSRPKTVWTTISEKELASFEDDKVKTPFQQIIGLN